MINALTLVTHVHRGLGVEGYRTVIDAGPAEAVAAARAEGLGFCLSELGLAPL